MKATSHLICLWLLAVAAIYYVALNDIVSHAPSDVDQDLILVENLKAECEEVHRTECEISVFYLPKASNINDE